MSTENLHNQEAIDKLKELVDKIDIGMMCTYAPGQQFIHAVPMSRQEVDEDGNNLQKDQRVSVLFSDIKSYSFLSVSGRASATRDESRIDKYWNKMMEGWFEKGREDPDIRVLRVMPTDAHYWDTKTNKLVTFLKVAASAISGAKMDVGRDGERDV
jgi:general stress protein 26